METSADIDDIAMLAEFAQLAMERARIAIRNAQALEAEASDPTPQLATFDRMGRAMRLALSLRRRFLDEAEQQSGRRVQARKEQLRAALTPAIRLHTHFRDRQDLDWTLAHRLETEADTFANLSFEAGVAHLSRLLGLPVETSGDEAGEVPQSGPADASADDLAASLTPDALDRARQIAARATGPP